jgi:hypothetical protein
MRDRLKPALFAGALAVLTVLGATRSSGQEAGAEQPCVYMGDVRRTTILDDNNILFYMRNGRVYQNHLRNTCFMLRSANRFTYGSSAMRRLCVGDLIQVLPESSFGGTPFPMATCNLGSYLAIDKEVADDLVATSLGKKPKEGGGRVKTSPVELPPATPPASPPAEPGAPAASPPSSDSPPPAQEPPKP